MTFFKASLIELISPFGLTLFITSMLLLLEKIYRLIALVVDKQLQIVELGLMVFYLVPQIITVTIPLSVVGAVFAVVIRQSTDSEVICLRATGCSLWRYSAPFLVFGVAATALTALFTLILQPMAYQRFSALQLEMIRWRADNKLIPRELNFDFGGKVLRIGGRGEDQELLDVFVADRKLGESSAIITAKKGRILVNEQGGNVVFALTDGQMHLPGNKELALTTLNFEALNYAFDFQPVDKVEVNRNWALSTPELLDQIARANPASRRRASQVLEYYLRLTIPWVCLAFSLAAITMGMADPRFGRSGSYMRALVLIVTYHVVFTAFKNLVHSQSAVPAALWFPEALIALYGLLRLWAFNADFRFGNLFSRPANPLGWLRPGA